MIRVLVKRYSSRQKMMLALALHISLEYLCTNYLHKSELKCVVRDLKSAQEYLVRSIHADFGNVENPVEIVEK